MFLGGWGRKSKSGKGIARQGKQRQRGNPGAFQSPGELSSSDRVHLEWSFAAQLVEVGVQWEARVMNQDKPISNA